MIDVDGGYSAVDWCDLYFDNFIRFFLRGSNDMMEFLIVLNIKTRDKDTNGLCAWINPWSYLRIAFLACIEKGKPINMKIHKSDTTCIVYQFSKSHNTYILIDPHKLLCHPIKKHLAIRRIESDEFYDMKTFRKRNKTKTNSFSETERIEIS